MITIFPLSVKIPTSSKPIFSVFGTTPAADKTTSASKISSPFAVLIVALTKSPVVSTPVTSAFVKTLIPDFFRDKSNCFEISSSSTGTIRGKYSTIVTSVPKVL